MKKAVMKKWVKALRSGEYKQTPHALCKEDKDGNCSFCCLGVLAELYVQENNDKVCWGKRSKLDSALSIHGLRGSLSKEIMKWSGLKTEGGTIKTKYIDSQLFRLNDEEGKSFKQLANIIEKNYKVL